MTVWHVIKRDSDGEIIKNNRGPHGDDTATPDPPRPSDSRKEVGYGIGLVGRDVWDDNGDLRPGFSTEIIVSDAKPYTGFNRITADGAVQRKTLEEVLEADKGRKALEAKRRIASRPELQVQMRESFDSWKLRNPAASSTFDQWLTARLLGNDPT
jgi:hypothetical protein